jgi:cobalt-zinc-cadmium efflux system outer membrane protein
MQFFRLLIITCLTNFAAATEAPLYLSAATIGQRIRAQNPDLAAARLRIDEAAGRLKGSGRLANPTLDTAVEHNSRFREGRLEIGFTQRFPVTNRLLLEQQISATQLAAAEKEVAEVERQLILAGRQAVVQLLSIRQRRDLLRQQTELMNQFAEAVAKSADRGEESPLDAAEAKLQGATLELEIRQLDAAEAGAIGSLKPLLGMRPGEPLSVGGSLNLPLANHRGASPEQRPDLQASQLEATAAGQEVALEQAKRCEDLEAGIFAAGERSEDVPDGYDNEAIVGLRVKIPLPLWNKNEGAIEAAQARQQRKELEAVALGRSIRLEIETARAEMGRWAQLARELTDTLLPLAEEQTRQAGEAYAKGQTKMQSVFRIREKHHQLASARLDALREYHLARVRYETAGGQP